jgi:hypothetical protein
VPSDIEIDDNFKLELNLKARIELLDKPGRRFCKRCLSMKVPSWLLQLRASSHPPLPTMPSVLAQDGPPLPIREQLRRVRQLQVLHYDGCLRYDSSATDGDYVHTHIHGLLA